LVGVVNEAPSDSLPPINREERHATGTVIRVSGDREDGPGHRGDLGSNQ
jgi:hypothetical protein